MQVVFSNNVDLQFAVIPFLLHQAAVKRFIYTDDTRFEFQIDIIEDSKLVQYGLLHQVLWKIIYICKDENFKQQKLNLELFFELLSIHTFAIFKNFLHFFLIDQRLHNTLGSCICWSDPVRQFTMTELYELYEIQSDFILSERCRNVERVCYYSTSSNMIFLIFFY